MKTLDILVKAIDNFGDFGFALDLSEAILCENPDTEIRFFGDNVELFSLLTQGKISQKIVYHPLENYTKSPPSDTVILCFDMKMDMDFFLEQTKKIRIFILSYLRFDDGVGSMNDTHYEIGNVSITHLVPSPREDGAGIIFRKDIQSHINKFKGESPQNAPGEARRMFFSEIGREIPSEIIDTYWVSVFCYENGRKIVWDFARWNGLYSSATAPTNSDKPITWIFFESCSESHLEILDSGNCIWHIPYLRFDEYETLLSLCDYNIVRGENSAIKAVLAGKPFLWDIYKESNRAHEEKLQDFASWTENPQFHTLLQEWNTSPNFWVLTAFLSLSPSEQDFFAALSQKCQASIWLVHFFDYK